MIIDPALVLADLLRVAAEDVGLDLDDLLEQRLAQRLAELLAVAGYELSHR